MGTARWLESLRTKRWFAPVARGPLVAFRLGLGPLIGRAFLVLTTRGHRTGFPRHTVLLFWELEGLFYVAAAYGHRSQWLRNLQSDPRVTVITAGGRRSCTARPLTDPAETAAVVRRLRKHSVMRAYLASQGVGAHERSLEDLNSRLLLVALEPTHKETPASVEADLVWVWALAAPAALAIGLLRRARATASGAP